MSNPIQTFVNEYALLFIIFAFVYFLHTSMLLFLALSLETKSSDFENDISSWSFRFFYYICIDFATILEGGDDD